MEEGADESPQEEIAVLSLLTDPGAAEKKPGE